MSAHAVLVLAMLHVPHNSWRIIAVLTNIIQRFCPSRIEKLFWHKEKECSTLSICTFEALWKFSKLFLDYSVHNIFPSPILLSAGPCKKFLTFMVLVFFWCLERKEDPTTFPINLMTNEQLVSNCARQSCKPRTKKISKGEKKSSKLIRMSP